MIRCIAIDDEALALDLLEDNIRRTPFLLLLKSFRNPFDALEYMRKEEVELIFLDIRMPDLTGLQLMKVLQKPPLVIMITAYEKYALEGFEMDVVDYLLKPVSYERFLKAASKARELILLRRAAVSAASREEMPQTPASFFVKSDYKQVRINAAEILYIEGLKDYVKIYCGPRPVLTQMSMKAILEKLSPKDFIRVHRSYIVNIHRIEYVQRMEIRIGNKDIPIGENFRDPFFNAINQNQQPT